MIKLLAIVLAVASALLAGCSHPRMPVGPRVPYHWLEVTDNGTFSEWHVVSA